MTAFVASSSTPGNHPADPPPNACITVNKLDAGWPTSPTKQQRRSDRAVNRFLLHSHFTYRLAGRKCVAELAHGAFENGMARVSGDFGQGLEDEAALVQFAVRNGQRRAFEGRAAAPQDNASVCP